VAKLPIRDTYIHVIRCVASSHEARLTWPGDKTREAEDFWVSYSAVRLGIRDKYQAASFNTSELYKNQFEVAEGSVKVSLVTFTPADKHGSQSASNCTYCGTKKWTCVVLSPNEMFIKIN